MWANFMGCKCYFANSLPRVHGD
uniref:Uncharacterized protein n=1 Tax=Arundo donax TaxID=35708 RepID=A0A0A9C5E5_ARUDO